MLKTSELTGAALDWMVNKCSGMTRDVALSGHYTYKPSTDWSQGGPIIEREEISLDRVTSALWVATRIEGSSVCESDGPTQLVAAMRCYVKSQFGDEVDVPLECLIYETNEEQ